MGVGRQWLLGWPRYLVIRIKVSCSGDAERQVKPYRNNPRTWSLRYESTENGKKCKLTPKLDLGDSENGGIIGTEKY